jgi:hypothetical protein
MMEHTMPKQVFDALKVILDEFGNCDLCPRLDYYAGECPDDGADEQGRQLLRAFNLVSAWHYSPTMGPDDIRDSLEDSDSWWKGWWVKRDEAA